MVDGQMERKQWDEALSTLDQCLALNPQFFPAYEAKADLYWLVRKDRTNALATLQAGLPYLAGDARLRQALGHFYLKVLKDYPKAQEELRLACSLDPKNYTSRGLLRQADAEMARSH